MKTAEQAAPKVSIILPVYNTAPYLAQCLSSILSQTLQEFEVLCVDDGSTDASPQILAEYAARDPRIQVITQQNGGAGAARNLGLSKARGKYLSFLDADDFFAPEMLAKTWAQCERTGADIVGFRSLFYNDRTGREEGLPRGIHDPFLPGKKVFNRSDLPVYIVPLMNDVVSNKFFLRSFVEEEGIRFLPLPATNDHYFCCIAMCCARRISYVDEVFYYHRQGQEGNTRMRKYKTPLTFWASWQAARETLRQKGLYPELEQAMLNDLLKKAVNQIHFLIKHNHQEACAQVYRALQEEMLPVLDLSQRGPAYYVYPEKYQEALGIQGASFEAYLFGLCAGAAAARARQSLKMKEEVRAIRQSRDFRLGSALLSPLRAGRRVLFKGASGR